MLSQPPNKKLKACHACHARKLKCSKRDGTSSPRERCNHCARSGISCVSSQQNRSRRQRPGRVVDALRTTSESVSDRNVDDEDDTSGAWTADDVPVSPSCAYSNDQIASNNSSGDTYMTSDRTMEVFDFFMRNIYATLPVFNFDNFMRLLHQSHANWDDEFYALAYALDMMHESYKYAITPTAAGKQKVISCKSRIEKLRCRYDYAEHATADTVIVSFSLFVAYIVIGKERRALLYLSEASKLVDFARTSDRIETMRIHRLKALLFITASAITLLSPNPALRADAPSSFEVDELVSWYDLVGASAMDDTGQEVRQLDRFAVRQLQLMTRIHLTARDRASWDILDEQNVANSISSVTLPATRMVRIVIADLSITQLWFSSDRRRLHNTGDHENMLNLCQSGNLAASTGRKALAWARSLSQEELRIVGLFKMVDILENMVHLCSLDPQSTDEVEILARDLMIAISTADYESTFASTLARSAELLRHIAPMYKTLSCRSTYQGSQEVTGHDLSTTVLSQRTFSSFSE
ncbi:hypothetical protein LTS07_010722 [Exophiala sideris]|uniref:Zn(2)-C6 fungal-type domain-containing protein n=1 Tax=Exophiala sideris TaxID=1016849 RepID=A0ABR0IW35_9EURO|nr:hypothetical protein LTS07_010722 [Exophiala sideris]KAK5050111.1 hypothetical protein LTR69_010745 [Exophiala sideris]KAK5176859.1 hypothetical protein LTR44_010555 [Eurotiomycetes sp. CCFEE 6388]